MKGDVKLKKKIGDFTLREVRRICCSNGESCDGCIFVTDTGSCMASLKYDCFYNEEVPDAQ